MWRFLSSPFYRLSGLRLSSTLANISDFPLRPVLGALACVRHLCLKRPSRRVGFWTPTTRSCLRSWHLESAVVDSPFSRAGRHANPVASRAAHPSSGSQRARLHD
jgi:hypothetical protein